MTRNNEHIRIECRGGSRVVRTKMLIVLSRAVRVVFLFASNRNCGEETSAHTCTSMRDALSETTDTRL